MCLLAPRHFLSLFTLLATAGCHKLSLFNRRHEALWRDEPSSVQVPLKRTEEGWYTVELQLAGSLTRLLVDTGSSALWARMPASTKMGTQGNGNSTSQGKFTAQYGRGAVSGVVLETPVLVPGAIPAKPHSCRVGAPTDEGSFWKRQRSIDGVLGLGCSSEDASVDALSCVVPKSTPKPLLLGAPQRRVFCLELTPSGGLLTLGSVPQLIAINLVSMPPAQDCGHWTVPLVSLSVHGNEGATALVHDAEAVLDSGSDGIIGPTFAVIELARRLGATPAKAGEGYGGEVTFYEVPCDATMNLPSITLMLGDAQGASASITLQGSDLVSTGKEDQENCHLRVAGWETQSWILGAVFLTHLQAIAFDVDKGSVAIAPQAQQGQ